jgi:hypothetical protein
MPRRRTLATGIHALRSLDGGYALGILPSLAANAGSQGTGQPLPTPFSGHEESQRVGEGVGASSRSIWTESSRSRDETCTAPEPATDHSAAKA